MALPEAVVHVLQRIATYVEDPERFDPAVFATRDELREFHASGLPCSFASWKVARLLREIAEGKRDVP